MRFSILFAMGINAVICVAMLIVNGFHIEFSLFSFLIALFVASINIDKIKLDKINFSLKNDDKIKAFISENVENIDITNSNIEV